MMYRDPTFDIEQMQTTMRHLYLDDLSRNGGVKVKLAGRSVAMAAGTSTCHTCGKEGHYAMNCWKNKDRNDDNDSTRAHDNKQKNKKSSGGKAGAKGAAGPKWCSVHRTTSHNDEECYEQGAPRP
ncbi:unnamed protein product, partial [Laminaria digitata]